MKRWLGVSAGMAVAGVAAGALWAWLAPPIHSAAAVTKSGKRVQQYLGNEADHYFDAAVMMAGLLVGLGVVAAVLVWQWRQRRGPGMVIGLTAGGLAAAAAAPAPALGWCEFATATSTLTRFRPIISFTTSPRRQRCSSGMHRCRC